MEGVCPYLTQATSTAVAPAPRTIRLEVSRGALRDLGEPRLPSDELAEKIVTEAILKLLELCGWRLEHKRPEPGHLTAKFLKTMPVRVDGSAKPVAGPAPGRWTVALSILGGKARGIFNLSVIAALATLGTRSHATPGPRRVDLRSPFAHRRSAAASCSAADPTPRLPYAAASNASSRHQPSLTDAYWTWSVEVRMVGAAACNGVLGSTLGIAWMPPGSRSSSRGAIRCQADAAMQSGECESGRGQPA